MKCGVWLHSTGYQTCRISSALEPTHAKFICTCGLQTCVLFTNKPGNKLIQVYGNEAQAAINNMLEPHQKVGQVGLNLLL
jgi:hypothetical protein